MGIEISTRMTGALGRYGPSRLNKAQKATRLLCLMAVFAFSSFALVDLYMVETSVVPLYCLRFVMVCVCLFIYWLAARPSMKVHAYRTGAVICIATGMGVVLLAQMTGGASSLYWTMIMLTFFTASLIMPFRPLHAGAVFATIALFYDVWIYLHDGALDSQGWVLSNAGIWLSALVSVVAVVYIDDLRDREDADRQRLEQLNIQLRDEITEREKAESELRRTQQLDAVGRLAAGMAHELNNVLLVISSSAELIQRNAAEPNKFADRILASAHRGARLTSDMLLFARTGHRENQPFSLNEVVENVAELVGDTQAMAAQVVTDLTPDDPWISGDSQLISQAVLNLCLNGVDAMDSPGVIQIQTCVCDELVELIVKDSGRGMSPQEIERAFEPFFTTKPPGKGTGLGLSMVYGTIKDHDGSIVIESELGQGTSVRIGFPIAEQPVTSAAPVYEPVPATLKEATILLVDDDQMVRQLMKENLEASGFEVVEAKDGADACQKFSECEEGFDLVILDMFMPKMSGIEAYQWVREQCADQRVLLYSGNNPDRQLAKVLENRNTRFLQKPFRQHELLDTVGQLLKD